MTDGQLWTAIATIIAALLTAVASSGLVNAIQNRGKVPLEKQKMEQDIISQIRSEGDKESEKYKAQTDKLEQELSLTEYKFDMLLEQYLEFIEIVKNKCQIEDPESFSKMRAKALALKYLKEIP